MSLKRKFPELDDVSALYADVPDLTPEAIDSHKKTRTSPDGLQIQFSGSYKHVIRWAKVSGSRTLDMQWQDIVKRDGRKTRDYRCVCNPFTQQASDDSEDESADGELHEGHDEKSSDDSGNDGAKDPKCDGGDHCPCGKPAADLPSHPYRFTIGGMKRRNLMKTMMHLRNPDNFDMHTFGDHMCYGALEVVQNAFLDFDEAFKTRNWWAMWFVLESFVMFMQFGDGELMYMGDDGLMVKETVAQAARMVMAGLASLEIFHRLDDDDDDEAYISNVGWIIRLYLEMATSWRVMDLIGPAKATKPKNFNFRPNNIDLYLRAYATRCGIAVPDMKAEDLAKDTNLTLPNKDGSDPWNWAQSFAKYRRECVAPIYAFRGHARRVIGGDGLDITRWHPEERKHCHFENKDPLSAEEIGKLEEGLARAFN